jgi:hypothetical protein
MVTQSMFSLSSNRAGFTQLDSDVYLKLQEQNRIAKVGDHAVVVCNKGRLTEKAVLLVKSTHKDVAAEASQ